MTTVACKVSAPKKVHTKQELIIIARKSNSSKWCMQIRISFLERDLLYLGILLLLLYTYFYIFIYLFLYYFLISKNLTIII